LLVLAPRPLSPADGGVVLDCIHTTAVASETAEVHEPTSTDNTPASKAEDPAVGRVEGKAPESRGMKETNLVDAAVLEAADATTSTTQVGDGTTMPQLTELRCSSTTRFLSAGFVPSHASVRGISLLCSVCCPCPPCRVSMTILHAIYVVPRTLSRSPPLFICN
jgi:hypothetical protein